MPEGADETLAAGAARIEGLQTLRQETSRGAKLAVELDRAVAALVKHVPRLEAAPRQVLDSVAKVRDLAAKVAGAPDFDQVLAGLEVTARAAQDRAAAHFGTVLAGALRARLPEAPSLRPMDSGFAFGALRILSDASAGRVHLEYAHQPVVRNLAFDPEAVAEAVVRFIGDLEKPPFDADAFLKHVNAAYLHCVTEAGKLPGELVEIIDFWSHLVWEVQPESFRRDPTARRFRSYPLYRFAHDLGRLRAARRFQIASKKLELEVAVHDRAYGKSLWVPEEESGGTYFQAIGLR